MEEYPSTEQITAVISPQNDDSQPDQSSFDGSVDSEPLSLVKNEAVPTNASTPEQEKDEKTVRTKARVSSSSSQNVVSSTTNSVSTSSLNYTLPELTEDGPDKRAKAATLDSLVDAISSGINDMKLSPSQVSD